MCNFILILHQFLIFQKKIQFNRLNHWKPMPKEDEKNREGEEEDLKINFGL